MFDLEKMAKQHGVQEYTIHGWTKGEMISIKMRRPGLYNMAAMGFVPNPLLGAMQKIQPLEANVICQSRRLLHNV